VLCEDEMGALPIRQTTRPEHAALCSAALCCDFLCCAELCSADSRRSPQVDSPARACCAAHPRQPDNAAARCRFKPAAKVPAACQGPKVSIALVPKICTLQGATKQVRRPTHTSSRQEVKENASSHCTPTVLRGKARFAS
jgi:hypothetical protein